MTQTSHKRRNFFIKKDLQGKYILSYFIHVFLGSIFFAIVLSIFSAKTMTVVYSSQGLQLGQTPFMIFKEILVAHWVLLIFSGLVVVIFSMLFTHRIAGPLFKFENTLDRMNTGDFSFTIYLRQKDEEQQMADKINQLLIMLSDNIGEAKQVNRELMETLALVNEVSMDEKSSAAMAKASELSMLEQKILDRFKVQSD